MGEEWSERAHLPLPARPARARLSPLRALAVVACLAAASWRVLRPAPPPAAPAAVQPALRAAPRMTPPPLSAAPAPASIETGSEGLAGAGLGESGTLSPGAITPEAPAAGADWRKKLDPLDTTSLHQTSGGGAGFYRVPDGRPADKLTPMTRSVRIARLDYDRHGRHETLAVCACTVGPRIAGLTVDGKAMGPSTLGKELTVALGAVGAHTVVIDAEPGWPLTRYTVKQDARGGVTAVAEYADGGLFHEYWGGGTAQSCPGR